MSEHGAILQSYNQELVKYIENLKNQKVSMQYQIEEEEKKKTDILSKIESLNQNLEKTITSLDEKCKKRDVCEKAINDAETGLKKIIESSQILLQLMQRETESLNASNTSS